MVVCEGYLILPPNQTMRSGNGRFKAIHAPIDETDTLSTLLLGISQYQLVGNQNSVCYLITDQWRSAFDIY